MGKCPNCGHSAWFLYTIPCKVCGETACDHCAVYAFKLVDPINKEHIFDVWHVCSEKCMETLLVRLDEGITNDDVPIRLINEVSRLSHLVYKSLTSQKNSEWLYGYISGLPEEERFCVSFDDPILGHPYKNLLLIRLQRRWKNRLDLQALACWKFEDAAKVNNKTAVADRDDLERLNG